MMYDNDSGAAYGAVMVAVFFGAAALIWLCFGYVANEMLTVYFNPAVEAGTVSMQTRNGVEFMMNVIRYAPAAILIMGFIWAVRRAVYVREGGQ